jgi:hypothetical protein
LSNLAVIQQTFKFESGDKMEKRMAGNEKSIFSLQNILITAGIAILAPYVIRRVLPLLTNNPENTSARDLTVAGKDSLRDAADDLGVGGLSGTLKRGMDRVADHLS